MRSRTLLALPVGLGAVALLGACSSTIEVSDLEEQVNNAVIGGSDADCGDENVEPEEGMTHTCTITAGGEEFEAILHFTEGNDNEWNFEVEIPELDG
ncbi:hypothetical protein [Glycomyces salinus]|uniref:hypothetical protein n=1 Tax=Glycomyces salinus TaxID=980294 RepID=UPI0018EBD0AF|nr:hypothetical protein [Glycomyces salinus]